MRRYATIVASMPPVARAAEDALGHDPWQMSESFLASVVDAACRRVMLEENLAETIEGADPARDVQVAWLGGLLADRRDVSVGLPARQEMTRRGRTWIAGRGPRRFGAWRLLLHLREPDAIDAIEGAAAGDDADVEWTLSFRLQAAGDESVVLDAEDIWLLAGEGITLSGMRCDQPREMLLRELGRASRLYKPRAALSDAEPTSPSLSTQQAYSLRVEAAARGAGLRRADPRLVGQSARASGGAAQDRGRPRRPARGRGAWRGCAGGGHRRADDTGELQVGDLAGGHDAEPARVRAARGAEDAAGACGGPLGGDPARGCGRRSGSSAKPGGSPAQSDAGLRL